MRSAVVAADGTPAGPVTGGTVVTVTGTDLEADDQRELRRPRAPRWCRRPADTVTLQTPAATDLSTVPLPVTLFASTGEPVQVAGGTAPATTPHPSAPPPPPPSPRPSSPTAGAAIAAVTPAAADQTPRRSPSPTCPTRGSPRRSTTSSRTGRTTTAGATASITGNDCVNFTSQSLIARGWTMDAEWSFSAGQYSAAWASSTAFAAYLTAHPERATPLTAASAPT